MEGRGVLLTYRGSRWRQGYKCSWTTTLVVFGLWRPLFWGGAGGGGGGGALLTCRRTRWRRAHRALDSPNPLFMASRAPYSWVGRGKGEGHHSPVVVVGGHGDAQQHGRVELVRVLAPLLVRVVVEDAPVEVLPDARLGRLLAVLRLSTRGTHLHAVQKRLQTTQ